MLTLMLISCLILALAIASVLAVLVYQESRDHKNRVKNFGHDNPDRISPEVWWENYRHSITNRK